MDMNRRQIALQRNFTELGFAKLRILVRRLLFHETLLKGAECDARRKDRRSIFFLFFSLFPQSRRGRSTSRRAACASLGSFGDDSVEDGESVRDGEREREGSVACGAVRDTRAIAPHPTRGRVLPCHG